MPSAKPTQPKRGLKPAPKKPAAVKPAAAIPASRPPAPVVPDIVALTMRFLDDRKAEKVRALLVEPVSSITDWFVIAGGLSDTHNAMLLRELERHLRQHGHSPLHRENGTTDWSWAALDYGEMIVHIFTDERRRYYNLEGMWGDAAVVEFENLSPAK